MQNSTGYSERVYLGIGSNIKAEKNVAKALALISECTGVFKGTLQSSPVYKNPAQDVIGDDFLNLVIRVEYAGDLSSLQAHIQRIERACGRQREFESGKGSRSIDLDLLMFGSLEGEFQNVSLPRADIYKRQFIWQPLLDLLSEKVRMTDFEKEIKTEILHKVDLANIEMMTPFNLKHCNP